MTRTELAQLLARLLWHERMRAGRGTATYLRGLEARATALAGGRR